MRPYPSIPRGLIVKGDPIYAFDKLDGSQLRAEWTKKKRRFWKFGTRKRLVSRHDRGLWGEAVETAREKYESDLHDIAVKERWLKVTCYFEIHGENSFAGTHRDDEPHDVTLFGVAVVKRGILEPRRYLKLFGDLDIARLLYHGNANEPFVESVRRGELEGMTFEGVVCKGKCVTPGRPLLFKVKNLAWLERLKGHCGDNQKLYETLA